jgi:hypothetical protein
VRFCRVEAAAPPPELADRKLIHGAFKGTPARCIETRRVEERLEQRSHIKACAAGDQRHASRGLGFRYPFTRTFSPR